MLEELVKAITNKSIDKSIELIEKLSPENLNPSNKKSTFYPLHIAVTKGLITVAEKLIEKGINLDRVDEEANSPLRLAVENNQPTLVKLLLNKGANVDLILNKNGENVLISQIRWHDDINQSVRELIIAGSNLSLKDKHKKTAIEYAADGEKKDYIKWLKVGEIANNIIIGNIFKTVDPVIHDPAMQELFLARIEFHLKKNGLFGGFSLEKYQNILPQELIKAADEKFKQWQTENKEATVVEKENSQSFNEGKGAMSKHNFGMEGRGGTNQQEESKRQLNWLITRQKEEDAKEHNASHNTNTTSQLTVPKKLEFIPNSKLEADVVKTIIKTVAEGNDRISGNEQQAILLLGNTGSGKSTLAHALVGKPLKAVFDVDSGEMVIEAVDPLDEIKISHSKTSETKVPNKCLAANQVVVWDCPGFNDTTTSQEIANNFFIRKLYTQHSQMKFVLVANETDITTNRGIVFTKLLEQFCSGFSDITKIKDSVSLVVTHTGSAKQVVHLQNGIKQILQQNQSLSQEGKEMIGYLMDNLQLFHQPYAEGALPESNLFQVLDEKIKYAEVKDGMGKFNLSKEGQSYCFELLKMSIEGLTQVMNTLFQAGLNPIASCKANESSIFDKDHEKIIDWLPAKVTYQRAIPDQTHFKDEYFTGINELIKLEKIAKQLFTPSNNNNNDDYGKDGKDGKDGKLDQVTTIIEKLFNVFEEFVVITSRTETTASDECALKSKIKDFAYIAQQMKGYCKLFAELTSKEDAEKIKLNELADSLVSSTQIFSKQLTHILKQAVIELDVDYGSKNLDYLKGAITRLNLQSTEKEVIQKKALCFKAIGDAWRQTENPLDALKYYYQALKLDSNLVDAYTEVAEIFYGANCFQEAIPFYKVTNNLVKVKECYDKLIQQHPDDYIFREGYGDVLFDLGLFSKAEVKYTHAESLTKNSDTKISLMKKKLKCTDPKFQEVHTKKLEQMIVTQNFYDFSQFKLEDQKAPGFYEDIELLGNFAFTE